ncbi:hypothetical protein NQ315_011977, partial [Exocentrus adspersus]
CSCTDTYKMAFVCPPKETSDKKAKILCRLKKVLKEIEDDTAVGVNPVCVPCCIPVCCMPDCMPCPAVDETPKQPKVMETPNVMVCYKIPPKKCTNGKKPEEPSSPSSPSSNNNRDQDRDVIRLKPSTSRELRASILYRGCDCEKRSGLQDDCRRTGCHGSPRVSYQAPMLWSQRVLRW